MYEQILALIATLLFHALLALALLLNLEWQHKPVVEVKHYETIDVVTIDESKLLAKLGSSKAIEFKKTFQHQWEQQQRLAAIRYEKLKQEEQRLEKIRLEQERAEELARLRKLEQERKQLEKQQRQERQRLAKLRQKQEELKRQAERKRQAREKKAAQQREAALRKQQEEARIAKERQEQQRQEAARQAKIDQQAAAIQQQREAAIQRQIAAKRKAIQDQRIAQVINVIRGKVLQQWQRPANTSFDLTCLILVNLTSKGIVTHAQLITSSGHTAFDSSAIRAVYQTSPLPIPKDLYVHFKSFTFTFRPQ